MLKQRVITALIMLAVFYAATAWLSPFLFAFFLILVMIPAALEVTGLMGLRQAGQKAIYLGVFFALLVALIFLLGIPAQPQRLDPLAIHIVTAVATLFWLFAFFLIVAFPQRQALWSSQWKVGVLGLLLLLPTWAGLLQLKYLSPDGYLVLALVALVSVVDIGAYFSGRAWGRSKLAPSLSPKKSWAGFWGGMASAFVLAIVLGGLANRFVLPLDLSIFLRLLILAMAVAAISVVGDLFESMLKRAQGIKDSGSTLPGHGGVLDRIDSLTAAAPVCVFLMFHLLADFSWD